MEVKAKLQSLYNENSSVRNLQCNDRWFMSRVIPSNQGAKLFLGILQRAFDPLCIEFRGSKDDGQAYLMFWESWARRSGVTQEAILEAFGPLTEVVPIRRTKDLQTLSQKQGQSFHNRPLARRSRTASSGAVTKTIRTVKGGSLR